MGTRGLTKIFDENGEQLINLYRQYDSYPTGHGAELAEFLSSGRMVNGLDGIGKIKQFNGAGCLAAQLVAHFKQSAGGFYIYPVTAEDCCQDYEYEIHTVDGELRIKIIDCGCNMFGLTQSNTYKTIFEGNLKQFAKYCSAERYDEEPAHAFDSPSGQDWVKSILNESVATVTFTKSDGTERVMKCTLDRKLVPEKGYETKRINEQVRTVSADVLPVYDVEAQGWRSFRWDSIKSVTVSLVKE